MWTKSKCLGGYTHSLSASSTSKTLELVRTTEARRYMETGVTSAHQFEGALYAHVSMQSSPLDTLGKVTYHEG